MRNMGCEDFSKAMGVKEEMNAEAEITDIQRFSVHDGTGIRTLVFFKGSAARTKRKRNRKAAVGSSGPSSANKPALFI